MASPGIDGVAISAISLAELLLGVAQAPSPKLKARRSALAEWLAGDMPVIAFGTLEARTHAVLVQHLKVTGSAIGAHDALIAATALANGHRVATLNVKHFGRVPGLELVDVAPFVRA
jgi:tRNA(fMet)-specific endonuclease VapC